MSKTPFITQQELKRILSYDPEIGIMRWLVHRRSDIGAGSIVGCLEHPNGYRVVTIKRRKLRGTHLIWLYMTGEWPLQQMDHINGRKSDDRWSNLRGADCSSNNGNKPVGKANTSGFKGVFWNKKRRRWVAQIKHRDRPRFLGDFKTPEAAHEAYKRAAVELFGEFARW